MTSIEIPNSVTSIGDAAFEYCTGLTSITIPNSVTSIGHSAFSDCTGLTSIEIPNSVTSIESDAFWGCTGLTSIEIPNSVTSIGSQAFYQCTGLTSIEIPNSVTSIGEVAFKNCSGLSSIQIPNSVTSIGESAFYGCKGLTSISIPENLKILKSQVFYGCSGLTSITIPTSIEFIYQEAFANCSSLKEVKALPEIPPFLYANSFSNYDIVLKVPEGSVENYMSSDNWRKFSTIQTLDGADVEKKKCATPTIAFKDGKLVFDCETEGVTFKYNIKASSVKSGEGAEVDFTPSYTITVYATKAGCENSETVTQEIIISGGTQDVNGDGIVDTQDVLEIYKYIQEH